MARAGRIAAAAAVLLACAVLLPSCAARANGEPPLIGGADAPLAEGSGEGVDAPSAPDDADGPAPDDAAIDLDGLDDAAPPEGFEPEGAALEARLDAYLREKVPRTGVPGVAVAVVDADGVRYLDTFGDCPGADAPFIIGSLSKSFTAAAVMQLAEQGLVDLDAPASSYAPGYDVPDEVTVRSLLNQTSGFGYDESLADAQVGDTFGSFSYANANYDLLGRVIEGATGETYAAYLDEHVLGPLGMASSTADADEAAALGMAPGHRDWFGLHLADGFRHAQGDSAWGGPASGYVAASAEDMASYLRMYLNDGATDGGARVLSPDSVRSMFLDRVPDPAGDTYYGMGWTSFYWDDGELVLSHDGQVENYVASMCLLPERGIGVAVLGDANDNAGGNDRFFDLAGGVVSVAIGAEGEPVDGSWTAQWRQRTDVLYACALLAAAAPLLLTGRWRRRLASVPRRRLLAQGLGLHAALPVAILALPLQWGVPWRDLLAFSPDAALVLALSAALLVVAGAAKLALLATTPAAKPPPRSARMR